MAQRVLGRGGVLALAVVLAIGGRLSAQSTTAAKTPAGASAKPAARDPVAELAAKLEPARKIVYKRIGEEELTLHVFEPARLQAGDRRPCWILFHGGGWAGGEPRRMYPYAEHFAKQGGVGISVQYRLRKEPAGTTVFECVKDGRSAVRSVRANASRLGVDPQKIVVSGASAGGHVAAGTALFDGVDEAGDDRSISPVPNALVLFYPVIDTSPAGYGQAKIGERWQEISPAHQVRGAVPATLIFHGTADTVTPFAGAVTFRDAMRQAGRRCELDAHDGGKHGYLMFDRTVYLETLHKTDTFLNSLGLQPKP